MILSPALPWSSLLWFLVGESFGLLSSSYEVNTVDIVVYVVQTVGA
jgi:hypothetical protein